jgi:hypothetical protein
MWLSEAAGALATLLHNEPWYHRTTFHEARAADGKVYETIAVWGEGDRPEKVPQDFQGFRVMYNRFSRKHPCPFGSVKKEYAS